MRKYRLTLLFLAVSATTIGIAALVISLTSGRAAEASLVAVTQEQAARDTQLIAQAVGRFIQAEPGISGVLLTSRPVLSSPGAPHDTFELTLQYQELLDALNVAEVRLYDLDAQTVWSSGITPDIAGEPDGDLFRQAAGGVLSSALRLDVHGTTGVSGQSKSDLFESYIPLVAGDTGEPAGVLRVVRDVTRELDVHAAQARSGMVWTTFAILGGALLVLMGFVVVADQRIWKANARALAAERSISARLGTEKDDLQRLNEAKNWFVSMITHELVAPLTSTIAFTDLVLRNKYGTLHANELRHLEVVRRNTGRLMRLINDMIDLARAERGALTVAPKEYEVSGWLQDVVTEMSPTLSAKSQPLKCNAPATGSTVKADRDRLTQVVCNLLTNASKYSREGTDIDLSASVGDGRLTISVTDHGIGMSPADQKGLFQMFYRVDNEATRSVSGSGIGLAIAQEIVKLHGGQVSVTSAPGAGTTVSFSIPGAQAASDIDGVTPAASEAAA